MESWKQNCKWALLVSYDKREWEFIKYSSKEKVTKYQEKNRKKYITSQTDSDELYLVSCKHTLDNDI